MPTSRQLPILLSALVAALGTLRDGRPAEASLLAFKDVRVFDGTAVLRETTVVVKGGTIATVAPRAEVPTGATIIEGKGKTLLPGLIDAHTHTYAAEHLRAAVVFGVTTELDMFTLPSFAASQRAEQVAGKAADRADLLSAGILATAPGGHGTEYGFEIPTITAADQAAAFVAARVA